MPKITVHHVTTYSYCRDVSFGEHRMMLRPRDSHDQRLLDERLVITPRPVSMHGMLDVFGNSVGFARFDGSARSLSFASTITIDHRTVGDTRPETSLPRGSRDGFYDADERVDLESMITPRFSDLDRTLQNWAWRFEALDPFDSMRAMATAIHDGFTYRRRDEPGVQSPCETLRFGTGSCRDFAVLMMEAARRMGLAARFVTGYVHIPGLASAYHGGGSTHAWVQVFIPGGGWTDFDPTNAIIGSRDLVRVAVTRDARQAVPLAGTYFGEPSSCTGMEVSVQVTSDEHDAEHGDAAAWSGGRLHQRGFAGA